MERDEEVVGGLTRAERDAQLLAEAVDVEDEAAVARRRRKQPVKYDPSVASAPRKKTKTCPAVLSHRLRDNNALGDTIAALLRLRRRRDRAGLARHI